MHSLAELISEAQSAATGANVRSPEEEVGRVLSICNSCRYCEGYCAVFPAMTRRLEFGRADVHYLANLCHNCGACLHACQYAPPHEFAVNVPRAMAMVRGRTYQDYAWPTRIGRTLSPERSRTLRSPSRWDSPFSSSWASRDNGALFHEPLAGNFYAVLPHSLLVWMFGSVFLFAVLALGIGVTRFWRDVAPGATPRERARMPQSRRWQASSSYATWTGDMEPDATRPMMRSRLPADASIIFRSTVSCSALRPRAWRRCITMSLAFPHRILSLASPSCLVRSGGLAC